MTAPVATAPTTCPDEHLREVLALMAPTPVIEMGVLDATDLVLGADLRAPGCLPAFDNAAMDGYAVRHTDLVGSDGHLPVAAEITAEQTLPAPLPPGAAAAIMTGAALPDGADTVVPVEHTARGSLGVHVLLEPEPGAHVRRRGEEHAAGDVLLGRGRRLRPVDAGILAAAGVARVPVHRRPRVAVLGTGSELVAPGAPLSGGAVHDANTTLLTALISQYGAEVTALPPLPDDPSVLRAEVLDASLSHDLVVTAGGISAGTREVVRLALAGRGVTFGRVAMSPGGPQGRGLIGSTPLVALPGNPSAALVGCTVFVRPAVHALAGLPARGHPPADGWTTVRTAAPLTRKGGRTRFVPVVLQQRDGNTVALESGTAHRLGEFAGADAVVRLEPGSGDLDTGSTVQALRL